MVANSTKLLFPLVSAPILGQAMDNVRVLRLDLVGGSAPGNKVFKLRGSLEQARREGVCRIVSFGGAWSNHLHALAALGAELGLETVGIVRGGERETAMIEDIRCLGMKVVPVSREEYRRRNDSDYLQNLQRQYAPCLVVNEGGANPQGVRGSMEIADLINKLGHDWARVVLPVGTGTTLAGLAAGLDCADELVGVSALKGASDLDQRIAAALANSGLSPRLPWTIVHDYHCGGFARANALLRTFITEFERVQSLKLEPVYTGKMLFAIHSLLASGQWRRDEPVLAIHTGGLQGRRGYPWLS
ncbi:MAG: pyridoxal-phosphate dependent enzyme [Halioglobus sp.]